VRQEAREMAVAPRRPDWRTVEVMQGRAGIRRSGRRVDARMNVRWIHPSSESEGESHQPSRLAPLLSLICPFFAWAWG